MDQTTSPENVNVAANNVASIAKAREDRASKTDGDGKKAPCIEAQYSTYVRWRNDIAIGGRAANGCIDLSMYRWKGTHWASLEQAEANRDFLDWCAGADPSKVSTKNANSATDTAATKLLGEPERDIGQMIAARGDDAIVPTPDGYLRIAQDSTIRMVPAEKNLGMTYCVPAHIDTTRVHDGIYTPAPVPPQSAFGMYLERFFPDLEVRALLQEACAATLLPRCFEKAFVFVGTGANGKSTLLHMLRALHPAHAAYRLEQSSSRFGNQEIAGKTLLIASEAPSFLSNPVEQQLKSIISRDPVSCERKRRDPITITPRATLVIAANEPLRFTDRTYGSARKYLHIPFSVRLSDTDPARLTDYHKRITEDAHEMSILLDWLLVGAQRLLARGRLPESPAAVTALADALRMDTDTVFAWAREHEVQQDMQRLTRKADLYHHYVDAVLDEGGKPAGAPDFWRRLKEIVGDINEIQRRTDHYGKRERFVDVVGAGVASVADPFPF